MPYWLRRPHIRIGRFRIYFWSGSWTWKPGKELCPCCDWNFYAGPFGLELDRPFNPCNDDEHTPVELEDGLTVCSKCDVVLVPEELA